MEVGKTNFDRLNLVQTSGTSSKGDIWETWIFDSFPVTFTHVPTHTHTRASGNHCFVILVKITFLKQWSEQ